MSRNARPHPSLFLFTYQLRVVVLLALTLLAGIAQGATAKKDAKPLDDYEQRIADQALWKELRQNPGYVLLIPAAEAHGDQRPASPDTAKCYQRFNLTDHGATVARHFYNSMRRHDIRKALTYSSQWCPALETATRLGLGYVHEMALLNDLPADSETARKLQIMQLKNWANDLQYNHKNLLVLVAHTSIMAALSGNTPEPQHMQVMKYNTRDKLIYVGSVPLD